jgi:hypothetical protein
MITLMAFSVNRSNMGARPVARETNLSGLKPVVGDAGYVSANIKP